MSPVPDFEDSGESEVDKKQLPDVVPVNSGSYKFSHSLYLVYIIHLYL